MNPILQSRTVTPLILPESMPRWCDSPFFRQESEEKWLLFLCGVAFTCNRTAYEVFKRISGTVTVGELLREMQVIAPELTFEDIRQLLSPFVENRLLQLDSPQKEGCDGGIKA